MTTADVTTFDPPVRSTGHMLRKRIAETPDRRAYSYPVTDGTDETWTTLTWGEVGTQAAEVGAGLISLGVRAEQRVAIASTTRYEWALADYGIVFAAAATVTVFPTTLAEDVRFILDDSDSTVVFVEDADQLAKITGLRPELPKIHTVVVLDDAVPDDADPGWVISMDDLRRRGRERLGSHPGEIDARIDNTDLDDLATLIYTSGTTGRPKGVLLPHRVLVFEVLAMEGTMRRTSPEDTLTIDDKQFLWLPLSHVMGKLLLMMPVHLGFETAIDGRVDRIVSNLPVVRPTFMGSAPRIFEKAYNGIVTMMADDPGPLRIRERMFRWASRVGVKVFDADHGDGSTTATRWDRIQARLADRLVFSTVRERFGGRIRYFISGSAALNTDISRWFGAAGMIILEAYGMTESGGGSCLGMPNAYRTGRIGRPLDGVELRIAEDGEILFRCAGVMDGYHNNPEATAEALSEDGWMHTGDIGDMDEDGFVRITDRKKELFKTSNGKYVAPALIEAEFKGLCPVASNLVVIGEGRPYVSALVALDEDALLAWAGRTGVDGDYARVAADPRTRTLVQGYIDELNSSLNRWEQVKRFQILPRDLTVENAELTPSLKLRRKPVAANFADQVEANYP
ncbi:AMP-dependent synthetase/ligase [Corynebacterium glyciniphilum]|uniref:AMP-dependent synthetase/ligase n=1 Tax=Corynebacterium glyciniphilum TaxID=1404244 RepID=UPI0011AB8ACA|nr:long-chain fatty acid--CoA ligase [Corynebacterium glyciniphilum]